MLGRFLEARLAFGRHGVHVGRHFLHHGDDLRIDLALTQIRAEHLVPAFRSVHQRFALRDAVPGVIGIRPCAQRAEQSHLRVPHRFQIGLGLRVGHTLVHPVAHGNQIVALGRGSGLHGMDLTAGKNGGDGFGDFPGIPGPGRIDDKSFHDGSFVPTASRNAKNDSRAAGMS